MRTQTPEEIRKHWEGLHYDIFRQECYAVYRMMVGHTAEELAKHLGKSVDWVYERLEGYAIQKAQGVNVKRIEGFGTKTRRPIGEVIYQTGSAEYFRPW